MTRQRFPASVVEQLRCYVYTLADPRNGRVFYVGKGTGNRVFSHANAALKRTTNSEKLSIIRKILAEGRTIHYEVIRHGLTEKEAYEVESALIDYIGQERLLNLSGGFHMERRGRMSAQEIVALYRARPVKIKESSLLIRINQLFKRNITPEELYEATRGNWVLGKRREKAKYALSVYKGVVRQVFRIDGWNAVPARKRSQKRQKRWRFSGEIAVELQHYVGKSVERYLKRGTQNPVRYINC